MTGTAVAATPVHSVTLPSGEKISSDMSPQERHNIVARAVGAPTFEPARAPTLQWHTDSTMQRLAQGDAQRDAKPTAPAAKPAPAPEPTPAEKIAALDAELQAAGIQQAPPALEAQARSAVSADQVDQAALDYIQKAYRAMTPEDRKANHAIYMRDLKEVYEGRRINESRGTFLARTAGNPGSDAPVTSQTPAELNYNAALEAAVQASDAKGTPSTAISPLLTHGYTLPAGKYADLKDLLDGLAFARKRNFSQAAVEKIIRDTWT